MQLFVLDAERNRVFRRGRIAPDAGILEDPVTGSSHTSLIPYWSERLGKKDLFARQLSKRGGELICKDNGERVEISGKAVTHMIGDICIPSK